MKDVDVYRGVQSDNLHQGYIEIILIVTLILKLPKQIHTTFFVLVHSFIYHYSIAALIPHRFAKPVRSSEEG